MMENNLKKSNEGATGLIIFISAALIFLSVPEIATYGAAEGLKICASIVIPSLFPFTVASLFFCKSGAVMWIGKKIDKLVKVIFGINGLEFSLVLISLTGGYPVGAKAINEMYKDSVLTKQRAEKLLMFSVNASPAFYISTIGETLLLSKKAGLILFISNALTCLVLISIFCRNKNQTAKCDFYNKEYYTLSDSLVISVKESASLFLNISAWVVLFTVIIEIVKQVCLNESLNIVLFALLEVTTGCISAAKSGIPTYLYSLILSFGGLSTVCQVTSAAESLKPSFFKIFAARVIHSAVSGLISYILLKLFPVSISTLSNSVNIVFGGFPLNMGFVFLTLLACFYLIYLNS